MRPYYKELMDDPMEFTYLMAGMDCSCTLMSSSLINDEVATGPPAKEATVSFEDIQVRIGARWCQGYPSHY